jgi:hypothetical protein
LRERLEKRLRGLEPLQRGAAVPAPALAGPVLAVGDVEDLDEAPENEVEAEAAEEEILDQATAAATLAELKIEIATLGRLEALAYECRKQTAMDSTPSASSRSRATLAVRSGAITAPAWLMRSPTSSCQRRGTSGPARWKSRS